MFYPEEDECVDVPADMHNDEREKSDDKQGLKLRGNLPTQEQRQSLQGQEEQENLQSQEQHQISVSPPLEQRALAE